MTWHSDVFIAIFMNVFIIDIMGRRTFLSHNAELHFNCVGHKKTTTTNTMNWKDLLKNNTLYKLPHQMIKITTQKWQNLAGTLLSILTIWSTHCANCRSLDNTSLSLF